MNIRACVHKSHALGGAGGTTDSPSRTQAPRGDYHIISRPNTPIALKKAPDTKRKIPRGAGIQTGRHNIATERSRGRLQNGLTGILLTRGGGGGFSHSQRHGLNTRKNTEMREVTRPTKHHGSKKNNPRRRRKKRKSVVGNQPITSLVCSVISGTGRKRPEKDPREDQR